MAVERMTLPWVVVAPGGVHWLGHADSEESAWSIALGWPDAEEIAEHKRLGWYAAEAAVTWKRPPSVAPSHEAQPQPDLLKALELGRAHAQWSVDRSTDSVERRMNQHDVERIDAAIAALGVRVPDGGQEG